MINDLFAPVVKTLFIPEGNPGVQEVKEIRAVPRVIQAEGDTQEITISGEMDLGITYVPIRDEDDEIPWRTIQFTENDDFSQYENEEQVLARLEYALKDEPEKEDDAECGEDQWVRVEISVPFTLAIGAEGLCQEHMVRLDPCVHSSNWFLVSPTAIEFEAVLQLAPQDEAEQVGGTRTEEVEAQIPVQQAPAQSQAVHQTMHQTMQAVKPAVILPEKQVEKPFVKPAAEQAVQAAEKQQVKPAQEQAVKPAEKQEVKPAVKPVEKPATQQAIKPAVKQEAKQEAKQETKQVIKQNAEPREERHSFFPGKYYFQMKFYRVQLGEDLDAIADKFGISRERISSLNAINEEEIRTGLLLSIPRN